jgi:hypothetical protein
MAQSPAQLAVTASPRSAKRALCHDPAASVPKAPATQTITTTKAVCGEAASATTPPAPSIIAAANCVGAKARSASCVVPTVCVWESDQVPNPAEATAAHTHSTPAINMASQYESGRRSARPAPQGLVSVPSQR